MQNTLKKDSIVYQFQTNLILTSDVHAESYPHRGTRGAGGGVKEPLPRVFYMLQYLEKIQSSLESLWSSLQDEVYFMGESTAGDLWLHQTWSPSRPPSWILPKIRNHEKKNATIGNFWCLTCKSPRMPRHSWDIFTVQSSKFEKFPSYKEAKSTKKMGKCSNSKMVWIISHHLLTCTVSSFIIYQFIISPQNRKLPSCIGLLMRNRDKSSFAVNQVCLSTFRVQWRFHIFQVILISTQNT